MLVYSAKKGYIVYTSTLNYYRNRIVGASISIKNINIVSFHNNVMHQYTESLADQLPIISNLLKLKNNNL